ncbi:unnamed protein product [Linum tenue]|uniref:Uncharacterized protein n=1 Tax=Linum tenue TaxID=586396 RepID=A0AAV0GPQ2_9ROSI|nr:unnamed protein product [Linum tenue]
MIYINRRWNLGHETAIAGFAHWRFILRMRRHLKLIFDETTSKRVAERKNERFQRNITKRGSVSGSSWKKIFDYPVGPIVLGFIVFVVVGSYNQDSNFRWNSVSKPVPCVVGARIL